jgi:hypothetical protein
MTAALAESYRADTIQTLARMEGDASTAVLCALYMCIVQLFSAIELMVGLSLATDEHRYTPMGQLDFQCSQP